MQIACEKCSTTYTLDERLIPPGGAPVQCTRCGHVFIALAAGAAPVQRSGTAIFGVKPPAAQSAPVPADDEELDGERDPRGNTQIFGRVPPPPPEPPRSSTQMFGAPPTAAAPPPPQQRPTTQMFGAVAAPPAPAAPASNPRTTQMFGAVSAPPSAAASRPRSTQMFGAVGAPAATPAPAQPEQRSSTQMFGAVATPPTAPAPPAPMPRTTQMFGAVATPPAAPPPAIPHSTQIFGTVSAPSPAPVSNPRTTQMFGAVTTPATTPPPVQPEQRSSTQMFGAVAAPPAPAAQPRSSTAMFGAVQPSEGGGALPKITFGGEAVSSPGTSEVTQAEARSPFTLADPRDIDPAMASTQQMPASELAKAMAAYRAAEITRLPPGERLPGAAGAPLQLQPQAPQSGMTAELQIGGQHPPPRPGMTAELQFQGTLPPRPGMTAEMQFQGTVPPRPGMTAELQFQGTVPPRPGMTAELQFQGTLPPRPGMTAELHVDHQARTPLAGTPYAPVQLPPEAPALEQLEPPGVSSAYRRSAAARKSPVPAILGLVALLALGGVGYFLLAKRAPSVPPEAAAAREAAVVLLRRDDPASRLRSIDELQKVVAQHPQYLEAQADLVTALALQLDDTRAQQERALGEVRVLEKEIERLTHAQSPSDWQNRVYVLGDEVTQLRREGPLLQERAEGDGKRLREEHERLERLAVEREELEPATAQLRQRARALFASVNPVEGTLAQIQEYEAAGTSEGWGKVALAQFVLNSRSSDDVVNRGRNAIEELVQTDSSFIRPYVLAARIAIRQERYEAAATALEAAAALNPEHQTARDLLEWAQASQRAVDAQ